MSPFTTFDKAIVATITPIILQVLLFVGIDGEMTVRQAVPILLTGIITGCLVFLKRNARS